MRPAVACQRNNRFNKGLRADAGVVEEEEGAGYVPPSPLLMEVPIRICLLLLRTYIYLHTHTRLRTLAGTLHACAHRSRQARAAVRAPSLLMRLGLSLFSSLCCAARTPRFFENPSLASSLSRASERRTIGIYVWANVCTYGLFFSSSGKRGL